MAKRTPKKEEAKPEELVKELMSKGLEQQLPPTGRIIRLKPVNHQTLLREGKMPDVLTPLVMRSVYQDLPDKEVKNFLEQPRQKPEDALKYIEAVDFICKHTIADNTKVEDLLLPEKRWIFRLTRGAAELLINFRHDEEANVEPVDEVEDVQPTAE
jgi:hypothetical protein